MPRPWRFASLLAVSSAALAASLLLSRGERPTASAQGSPILEAISVGAVESAVAGGHAARPSVTGGAIVLPHHLVAAPLIGRAVGALRNAEPKTIVILGPDHRNAGPNRHTVSASPWRWAGQTLRTDASIVRGLEELPSVSVNDAFTAGEHSVLTPLPFLSVQFPEAAFVLVAIRGGIDPAADHALAAALDRLLGPDDLVVASVDFSHHRDLAGAQAEDARSRAVLEAGGVEAFASLPVDSPAALVIAARFAQRRGGTTFTVWEQGNAALLLGAPTLTDTTGYLTGTWASGGKGRD